MSYYGRQALQAIENGEAELDRKWWERYSDRFTPDEKRLLSGPASQGRTRAQGVRFFRSIRPFIIPGWHRVTHNLDAHVVTVKPHLGRWVVIVDQLRDFRAPASECVLRPVSATEPISTLTLVPLEAKRVGEPERMDAETQSSRLRRAQDIREAIQNQ